MDDKSNELLQQILAVQKEQAALLRQHLGRFKFSIRGLLILTTLMCLGLGVLAHKMPSGGRVVFPAPSFPAGVPFTPYVPTLQSVPNTGPPSFIAVPHSDGPPNAAQPTFQPVR